MRTELRTESRSRPVSTALLVAMLLLCGGAQAQKIYKWVDQNGKTHYGDSAPSDMGTAQEIRVPKTPAVDVGVNTRKQRTERLLDAYKQERDEQREARQVAAEEKKKREANCALAEESQFKYQHAATLYRKDAEGNRVNLSDEEYAKAMADLQAEVDEWCDGSHSKRP